MSNEITDLWGNFPPDDAYARFQEIWKEIDGEMFRGNSSEELSIQSYDYDYDYDGSGNICCDSTLQFNYNITLSPYPYWCKTLITGDFGNSTDLEIALSMLNQYPFDGDGSYNEWSYKGITVSASIDIVYADPETGGEAFYTTHYVRINYYGAGSGSFEYQNYEPDSPIDFRDDFTNVATFTRSYGSWDSGSDPLPNTLKVSRFCYRGPSGLGSFHPEYSLIWNAAQNIQDQGAINNDCEREWKVLYDSTNDILNSSNVPSQYHTQVLFKFSNFGPQLKFLVDGDDINSSETVTGYYQYGDDQWKFETPYFLDIRLTTDCEEVGAGTGGVVTCEDVSSFHDNFYTGLEYSNDISITDWIEPDEADGGQGAYWTATGNSQIDPIANTEEQNGLVWNSITDYTKNLLSKGYGDIVWTTGEDGSDGRGNFYCNFNSLLTRDGDKTQIVGLVLRDYDNSFILLGFEQTDSEIDENGRYEYEFTCREIHNSDPDDVNSVILERESYEIGSTLVRFKAGDYVTLFAQDLNSNFGGIRKNHIQGDVSVHHYDESDSNFFQFRYYTNLNINKPRMYSGIFLSARDRESSIDAIVKDVTLVYTNCYGMPADSDCCGTDLEWTTNYIAHEGSGGSSQNTVITELFPIFNNLPDTIDCENLTDGWQVYYEYDEDLYVQAAFSIVDDIPRLRLVAEGSREGFAPFESTVFTPYFDDDYQAWKFDDLPFSYYTNEVVIYLSQFVCTDTIRGKGGVVLSGTAEVEQIEPVRGVVIGGNSVVSESFSFTASDGVVIGGSAGVVDSFHFAGTGGMQISTPQTIFDENGTGSIAISGNSFSKAVRKLKTITVPINTVEEDLNGFYLGMSAEIETSLETEFKIFDSSMRQLGSEVRSYDGKLLIIYFSCNLFRDIDNVFYLIEEVG